MPPPPRKNLHVHPFERLDLLDIGAGLGYYSEAFSLKNINVTYLDADKVSYDFAVKHHRHIGSFEFSEIEKYLRQTNKIFDVIFCRHFIEHTFEPHNFLKLLYNKLSDKGIIIFETDNNASKELLEHPTVTQHWGKFYMDNYKITNFEVLKNLYITALSSKHTHWWSFNQSNFQKILTRFNYRILFHSDYHLGDKYLWPNVSNFLHIKDYFHIRGFKNYINIMNYLLSRNRNEGAGIIFIVGKFKNTCIYCPHEQNKSYVSYTQS